VRSTAGTQWRWESGNERAQRPLVRSRLLRTTTSRAKLNVERACFARKLNLNVAQQKAAQRGFASHVGAAFYNERLRWRKCFARSKNCATSLRAVAAPAVLTARSGLICARPLRAFSNERTFSGLEERRVSGCKGAVEAAARATARFIASPSNEPAASFGPLSLRAQINVAQQKAR
jgi:hypothetical protein